jgi:hypothetical protein
MPMPSSQTKWNKIYFQTKIWGRLVCPNLKSFKMFLFFPLSLKEILNQLKFPRFNSSTAMSHSIFRRIVWQKGAILVKTNLMFCTLENFSVTLSEQNYFNSSDIRLELTWSAKLFLSCQRFPKKMSKLFVLLFFLLTHSFDQVCCPSCLVWRLTVRCKVLFQSLLEGKKNCRNIFSLMLSSNVEINHKLKNETTLKRDPFLYFHKYYAWFVHLYKSSFTVFLISLAFIIISNMLS